MAFQIQGMADFNFQPLNDYLFAETSNPTLVEHSQQMQLPVGQALFKEWYFDGIRMGYSDWSLSRPVDVEWHYDIHVDLITFQVNLSGSLLVQDTKTTGTFLLPEQHHNLFYSPPDVEDSGVMQPNNRRITVFIVQFTKGNFLALTQGANEALSRFGESVISGKPAVLSPRNLPLEASFKKVIHAILHCGYSAGIKKMFLLSKTIELLVMQAEASNAILLPTYQYLKSSRDIECMMDAREYLMKNLETPPNLSQLSRIIGVNEYKLKRGFKEVFNTTVFGYLSEARLEMAKNDLLETNKKVIEIAYELGYSSAQHFSMAFKKKFGCSPITLRK